MKKTLFDSDERSGLVDIFFTEDEIITLIDLLIMTKQVCVTAGNNLDAVTDFKSKEIFANKAVAADILLNKILVDSNPGVPQGDLH